MSSFWRRSVWQRAAASSAWDVAAAVTAVPSREEPRTGLVAEVVLLLLAWHWQRPCDGVSRKSPRWQLASIDCNQLQRRLHSFEYCTSPSSAPTASSCPPPACLALCCNVHQLSQVPPVLLQPHSAPAQSAAPLSRSAAAPAGDQPGGGMQQRQPSNCKPILGDHGNSILQEQQPSGAIVSMAFVVSQMCTGSACIAVDAAVLARYSGCICSPQASGIALRLVHVYGHGALLLWCIASDAQAVSWLCCSFSIPTWQLLRKPVRIQGTAWCGSHACATSVPLTAGPGGTAEYSFAVTMMALHQCCPAAVLV